MKWWAWVIYLTLAAVWAFWEASTAEYDRAPRYWIPGLICATLAVAIAGWKLLLYCVRELGRAARGKPPTPEPEPEELDE